MNPPLLQRRSMGTDYSLPTSGRPFDPTWRAVFIRDGVVPTGTFRGGLTSRQWKDAAPAARAAILDRTAPLKGTAPRPPAPAVMAPPAVTEATPSAPRHFVICHGCGEPMATRPGARVRPFCGRGNDCKDKHLRARTAATRKAAKAARVADGPAMW